MLVCSQSTCCFIYYLARFDVIRRNKHKHYEGIIVDTDFNSSIKRVKFHFPRVNKKFDEWIELPSNRIAPLGTHTSRPVAKIARTPGVKNDSADQKVFIKKQKISVRGAACVRGNILDAASESHEEKQLKIKKIYE